MKIKAPYKLHVVVDCKAADSGQVVEERWYISPFRLWRRAVLYPPSVLLTFDYDLGQKYRQLVGRKTHYEGKSTWRRS
jgi:hypothetical protein